MDIDITDYPELSKVLVDVVNVPSDQLQHLDICRLDPHNRELLLEAYIQDACEADIHAVLMKSDIHANLALSIKDRMSTDGAVVTVNDPLYAMIYEIAQEMGPILEQIEQENHEGDRINE